MSQNSPQPPRQPRGASGSGRPAPKHAVGGAAVNPWIMAKCCLGMIGRTFVTLMMVGIITGCIVACVLTVYILKYIGADEEINLETVRLGYTSIMYYTDPETGADVELKRLYYGGEDRIWVGYDEINDYTKKAIVAIEDKRFWNHGGVDWKRTFAAFVNLFVPLSDTNAGGGSTITQQLIKNVTGDNEYRVERKVQEIFRALNLSNRYSREQILEAYLNLLPLGNGTNGIQAAANLYFGKDAIDLTLAESAALVGITQYPGRYDPFTNPENNKTRQEHVLKEMLDQKLITQEEYDQALKETLVFLRDQHIETITQTQSYFVDHVINEVIEDLMEYKGMTQSYATEQLYKGGYRIYTTVDMELQQYLEEFYLTEEKFPHVDNEVYPQSAAVIIDPNGKMLAVVGGIGKKEEARIFNRATMSRRHPGSSIKPLGAYVLNIESNNITWSTIIEDSPLTGEPGGWSPSNYYAGFDGPMTVNMALQRSVNTIAAKLVQVITPRRVFDFLHDQLEFEGLVERAVEGNTVRTDVATSPMALGALTYGVSPLEMAGGYQIFVNGGTFTPPYSYTRIEDASGKVILEKDTMPRQVISRDTSVLMNKLLQQVVTGPRGTGTRAGLGTMPTAGKTGTSQDDVNQWFVGFTPYYVMPVWMGYDKTTRIAVDSSGRAYTAPNTIYYYTTTYPPPVLWRSIMAPLHEDLEYKQFIESDTVVSRAYCNLSGELATTYCESTGTGWYKSTALPGNCTRCMLQALEAEESGDGDSSDDGTDLDRPPSIFDGLDLDR